ncbi:hypothetical protein M3Y99_01256800 [Aphelenchoides fujianensis]|nr:hypothetical protein M3Y99_01256800 [Aphelenchoides fujianensis]
MVAVHPQPEGKKVAEEDRLAVEFEDPPAETNGAFEQSGFSRWVNLLLCRSDLADEKLEARPVSFVDLFKYASPPDRLLVWLGIFLGVVSGIGQPLPLLLAGKLSNALIEFNSTTSDDSFLRVGYTIVAIDGSLGVFFFCTTFIQYLVLRLACRNIIATLRSRFIHSVLRKEAVWLDQNKAGAINNQLNEQINVIREGIAEKLGLLVRGLSMFATSLVIAFIVNWKIAASMFLCAPFGCMTVSLMARFVAKSSRKQTEWLEKAAALLHEGVINVRTVQSCRGEGQMVQKFAAVLKGGQIHGIFVYFWSGLFEGLFFWVLYIFYMIGLCFGAFEVYHGRCTLGEVLICSNSLLIGAYFLGVMAPHIMSILKARVAAAVIYAQIEESPLSDFNAPLPPMKRLDGRIEFENVQFAYPTAKSKGHPVLRGLSFVAEAGQTTALVGKSGCGKSSSISLLLRLYSPTAGRITADGRDIRSFELRAFRRQFGVVLQDPVLFSGSILENIAMGDEEVTLEQVQRAARLANCDFIENLSDGYFTQIAVNGGSGVSLSGGQKQRISIARAVLHDPPVVLLDEATSALDAESEIKVQAALKEASRGRATIVIAHRLSTLRDVDKIVVIDEGRVVEEGTHSELTSKSNGLYASFVFAQQFEVSGMSGGSKPTEERPVEEARKKSSIRRSTLRSSIRDLGAVKSMERPTEEDGREGGGLFHFYRNLHGHYAKLAIASFFSLMRGLEIPGYLIVMTLVFTTVQTASTSSFDAYRIRIIWIGVYTFGLGVFSFVFIWGSIAVHGWVTEEIGDELKTRAFANVLRLDASFYDKPETANAKVVQRIGNDSTSLKAATDNRLYHLVNSTSSTTIQLVLAFIASYEIVFVGMGVYSVFVIALYVCTRKMRVATAEAQRTDETAKLAVEIIENTRAIQISILDSTVFALTQVSIFFSDCFTYAVGLHLLAVGRRSAAEVFFAAQGMSVLSWVFLFVSLSINEVLHAAPAANSLFALIDAKSGVRDGDIGNTEEKEANGEVHFRDVKFAYPARPTQLVANGLNLRARRGEMIALVGPSGGGKSSAISLLLRFYDPNEGRINLDGVDIRRFTLDRLRSNLAVVGQMPILFAGSIYDNVCFGSPAATREDVEWACREANAADFIERLRDGSR